MIQWFFSLLQLQDCFLFVSVWSHAILLFFLSHKLVRYSSVNAVFTINASPILCPPKSPMPLSVYFTRLFSPVSPKICGWFLLLVHRTDPVLSNHSYSSMIHWSFLPLDLQFGYLFVINYFSPQFPIYYPVSSLPRDRWINVVLIFNDSLIIFAPSTPIWLSVH